MGVGREVLIPGLFSLEGAMGLEDQDSGWCSEEAGRWKRKVLSWLRTYINSLYPPRAVQGGRCQHPVMKRRRFPEGQSGTHTAAFWVPIRALGLQTQIPYLPHCSGSKSEAQWEPGTCLCLWLLLGSRAGGVCLSPL